MKEIVHFNSQKERLAYIKGEFEEIVPEEVKEEPVKAEKTESKSKKKSKKTQKDEDNGEVLAE